jgi:hypothetical protein
MDSIAGFQANADTSSLAFGQEQRLRDAKSGSVWRGNSSQADECRFEEAGLCGET